jgi:hypothetical protein
VEKVLFASGGAAGEFSGEDDLRASRQAREIEAVDAGVGPAVAGLIGVNTVEVIVLNTTEPSRDIQNDSRLNRPPLRPRA